MGGEGGFHFGLLFGEEVQVYHKFLFEACGYLLGFPGDEFVGLYLFLPFLG
jgi:hypothetical protein